MLSLSLANFNTPYTSCSSSSFLLVIWCLLCVLFGFFSRSISNLHILSFVPSASLQPYFFFFLCLCLLPIDILSTLFLLLFSLLPHMLFFPASLIRFLLTCILPLLHFFPPSVSLFPHTRVFPNQC